MATANFYQALPIRGGCGGDRSAAVAGVVGWLGGKATVALAIEALRKATIRGRSMDMLTNQSVVFRPADLAAEVAIGQNPATSGRYFTVLLQRR